MRIFTLSKTFNVVCNSESTSYGFRHIATLHKNGISIAKAKICYYNRTWECFEYESILLKIVDENFEDKEKNKLMTAIKKLG